MNFSLAGIQQSLREFWLKLSRPQKIIIVVAPLIVAIALITLILWAGKPQYVPIFTDISAANAGSVTAKLKDLNVPYTLSANGTTILVPQKQADEVRLELANAGLPQGSKFSFDNLDSSMHLGETDADRQLRYQLGLQNELETTLETMSGVQKASVALVIPEQSLYSDTQNPTTASVTLSLVPGTKLSDDQIRGIANLMAASVEGLKVENVTIVDTDGNVLSDVISNSNSPNHLTTTQIQLQQAVEDDKEKSIQSMLDKVFKYGSTVVRVNAELDFDQIKITQQTNGPGAVLSEQDSSQSSTSGSAPSATPGVTTNVPSYQSPTTSGTNTTSQSTSTTKNYQVDTTQEERVVSPGAIKRLSVSVMVDADAPNVKGQESQIKDTIAGIVTSAAGIDLSRGDQIQVAAIPFNKSGQENQQQQVAQFNLKQQQMLYIELGAAGFVVIVVLLLFWRSRARRKRREKELALEAEFEPVPISTAEEILFAQQQAEAEAQAKLEAKRAKSADEIGKQKLKEAVELYSRNNPDEVARLIKMWLAEEK